MMEGSSLFVWCVWGIFLILGASIPILILYARWNYGKLRGLGFPVIPRSFILGSVPDLHTKVQHFEDIKRFQTYGPVWGMNQGRTPIVFIADPQLIKKIFVTESSYFYDRQPFVFGDPYLNEIIDNLPGKKWKALRVAETKIFSTKKLREYGNNIFNKGMEELKAGLDEKLISCSGHTKRITVNMREEFCKFSVHAIGRALLSMDVKSNSGEDEFYKACRRLIGEGQNKSPFYVWTLTFPFLAYLEPTLNLDPIMISTFKEKMMERVKSGERVGDYVDVMLDMMRTCERDKEMRDLGITEITLLGQAVNLFLAGFDGISTMLTFLVYHLAAEPEAQRRVHQEIDAVVVGHIDAGVVGEMPFLNACVMEISRMYPTFIRPERVCNREWVCKESGIRIPRGVLVQIPTWAVNRDPNVYPQPNEFKPERFLSPNKEGLNPFSYTSFGFGHRNCMGKMFALHAMRMAAAHMLQRYSFHLNHKTKISFKPGIIFIIQYDPIYIDVELRTKELEQH